MKRFLMVAMAAFFLISANTHAGPEPIGPSRVRAQVTGPHSVTIAWTLSTDDTTTNCTTTAGCAENVYRGNGACSTSTVFTNITLTALGATTATFTDGSAVPGNICYGVAFSINGVESAKDVVTVTLPPFPPTGATGTGH